MTHVSERSTTFNPETLHILGSALDDALQRLEVRVHLNGSGEAISHRGIPMVHGAGVVLVEGQWHAVAFASASRQRRS